MSQAAQEASIRFIQGIKSGKFLMDTLPNSFENYTGYYEQTDLQSYEKYINSMTYEIFLENREVLYYGD